MTEIPNEYGPATAPHAPSRRRKRFWRRVLGWTLIGAPLALLVSNPVVFILAIPAFLPFFLAGSFILFVLEPTER